VGASDPDHFLVADAHERILAFLRRNDELASTRVERFEFGTACFHDSLPDVWDRNFVRVEVAADALGVEALIADADRLQGDAGLRHRKLVFEQREAAALAEPALSRVGFHHSGLTLMAYGRGRPPAAGEAVEIERDRLTAARQEFLRTEPFGDGEEMASQILDADLPLAVAVDQRWFARLVDGEPASYCCLYSDGETAQIEEVVTLPRFRRRGFADAVVGRAVVEAMPSHTSVFLVAREEQWPAGWYERRGFKPVGSLREALMTARPSRPGSG
jgi:ribosomal protein S18 acetylase RimI-like enzyme